MSTLGPSLSSSVLLVLSASLGSFRRDRPYVALPRWRRWVRCARVLPAAGRLAARVWWRLRRRGGEPSSGGPLLPALLRRLSAPADRRTLDPDACLAVTDRLVRPGREDRCLPRALVLFGLLQRSPATDVRFCLGVRPNRSASGGAFAHAWVEVEGQPFGEATDPRETHRLLYDVPRTESPRTARV